MTSWYTVYRLTFTLYA